MSDSLPSRARAARRSAPAPVSREPVYFDEIGPVPPGIASRPDQPGVLLHDVFAAVQARVPSATGLAVRDGYLSVAHGAPPDEQARAATRAVLADPTTLAQRAQPAAMLAGPADLRKQLLDPTLTDEAWLAAFRRYQVALLASET
jgi:hypothetical protein